MLYIFSRLGKCAQQARKPHADNATKFGLSFLFLSLKDDGYPFMINNEPRYFRGTIAYFSGDNLGSQFIGGFKQGSQAHRKCRVCMADNAQIQTKVSKLKSDFNNNINLNIICC